MNLLSVDLAVSTGAVKPMHCVNNGPVHSFHVDQRVSNLESYRAAGIPYARTHDASFYATYGGEHTIDISAVFPDFNADAYDPASYDFIMTDEYLRVIQLAGTKVFYRLGSKIEHGIKKYGTLVPKDFQKWAVICEHIIRHYNEGWSDGFYYNITYWEIWNEPDLDPDDSNNKRCWGGTAAEYRALYTVAARHLKSCFPHLKIGGPAVSKLWDADWIERFLALDAPLDFFSWHIYANDPHKIAADCQKARDFLDRAGRKDTESILNEWNYVCGWTGDDWFRSIKTEKSIKGAAFIAATMCLCQAEPLDMLMYYDARPCTMNGMYCTDRPSETLKGYFPFRMFNTLYQLGEAAAVESDCPELTLCAAKNGGEAAILAAYFDDDDTKPAKDVSLTLKHADYPKGARVIFSLLDADHDDEVVKEELLSPNAAEYVLSFRMPLDSAMLIRVLPAEA